MDKKLLSLLGLCQRAGRLVSGELSCENAVKEGNAQLIILAGNASKNTKKKFENTSAYYNVKLTCMGAKEEIGSALGKEERAVVVITDKGFSDKIIQLLEKNEVRK